ncbi:hypothetical protein G6F56_012729 [Rhizopus delemar]|nr:hypothetical protein G6F56_012729 [Rhizopus delemar]
MEHLHIPTVQEDDISCKRQKLDTAAFESIRKEPVIEKDIQIDPQEEYIEEGYPEQVESTDNYVEETDEAVDYVEEAEEAADNYMEETEEITDGYIEQTEQYGNAEGYTEQMNEAEQDKQTEEPDYTEEYAQNHTAPQFNYPPPPPVAGQDDGLSNVIMAWYYAGYYTALYQRNQSQR